MNDVLYLSYLWINVALGVKIFADDILKYFAYFFLSFDNAYIL